MSPRNRGSVSALRQSGFVSLAWTNNSAAEALNRSMRTRAKLSLVATANDDRMRMLTNSRPSIGGTREAPQDGQRQALMGYSRGTAGGSPQKGSDETPTGSSAGEDFPLPDNL